jgi:hypothetical protein
MNEWRLNAIKRHDERHTKAPEREPPKPVPAKKDTRRWCKGIQGRPHVLVWKRRPAKMVTRSDGSVLTYAAKWLDYTCTICGKQLDYWWPSKRDRDGTKVPKPKVE